MKCPGTLVRHADREHLLIEGGFNPQSRAVVVLVRPGDPDFPTEGQARQVSWGAQGQWVPVARRTAEGLAVPDESHAAHTARVQAVL
ncbi:MAG: hypothetical protein FJ296_11565, partial [Planctomycetes bacterium]|nr:hypothetical protein [Planctomycetota bacterium]